MKTAEVHYVEFRSPGTFFDETGMERIGAWDTKIAAKAAAQVTARHGARPYGFVFLTRLEAKPVSDGRGGTLKVEPKILNRSGIYFINGKVLLLDDVPDTFDNRILRSNMAGNGTWAVVETRNSYKHTAAFGQDDCCVDGEGTITRRGNDADLVAYRKKMDHRKEQERVHA